MPPSVRTLGLQHTGNSEGIFDRNSLLEHFMLSLACAFTDSNHLFVTSSFVGPHKERQLRLTQEKESTSSTEVRATVY